MIKIIKKLERFIQTGNGQRMLQYAYSFGAAIVILGAMVKVLHLWGVWGNIIFATGMTVECIVFILYGLDRPPKAYEWEKVFPAFSGQGATSAASAELPPALFVPPTQQPAPAGSGRESTAPMPPSAAGGGIKSPQTGEAPVDAAQIALATETLTSVSQSLNDAFRYIIDNSRNIGDNSRQYTQQMETLNKNIAGINTIYEIQLKTISGQIETLDQINSGLNRVKEMYGGSIPDSAVFRKETEKMTESIKQLNDIYARLIRAMSADNPPVG